MPRHSPYALSSLTYCLATSVFRFFSFFQNFPLKLVLVFILLPSRFVFYIFFNVLMSIACIDLVGSNGIEPSTSRLSGVRSNHLSYEPIL